MSARLASKASARCTVAAATTTATSPIASATDPVDRGERHDVVLLATPATTSRSRASAVGCAVYSSPTTSWSWSWSRTVPTKTSTPPARRSATAASTSATSSGVSRSSTRRTTDGLGAHRDRVVWRHGQRTASPATVPDEEPNNPFKGTPFEQIFPAFGGPAAGAGMPDLSQLMSQMQAMMTPHEGSVNWDLAKDVARRTVAEQPDPSPDRSAAHEVADAMRLADHWLDSATEFPSGVRATAAWSRAEWVEQTIAVWQRLVEPVAEHVVSAMGNALPAEVQAMAGPLLGILGQAGGAMFGTPGRPGRRWPRRRGAQRLRHRPAARTRGHGRAAARRT